jgi:prepilin-type N-terminal cleavage/methylation domain-containing protein
MTRLSLPRSRPVPPRVADDAGFALLEVLVAFVLFAIVAASATVAIANSISVSNTTRNRVTATGLAQAAIAKARADATTLMATPAETSTSGAYTVVRTVTVPVVNGVRCPAGEAMPVTVSVTWRQHGNRSVRVDTVIAC